MDNISESLTENASTFGASCFGNYVVMQISRHWLERREALSFCYRDCVEPCFLYRCDERDILQPSPFVTGSA